MCGIVATVGDSRANEIVIKGLKRLEYRGYDSCGLSYIEDKKIKTIKSINRVKSLENNIDNDAIISLGHTRWATHGGISLENAHPHVSNNQKIVLIHNGVIENYNELYNEFLTGLELKSQTDSEIILEVVNKFYQETNDMNLAISMLIKHIKGSYALVIYNVDYPDTLFAAKNKSPLLIGNADEFYTFSSDPSAVINYTNVFHQFSDKTFCVVTKDEAYLFDANNQQINFEFSEIDFDDELIEIKDYDSFMLKEIEEQPVVLNNIVNIYKNFTFNQNLIDTIKLAKKIYIVASGTSYHAGLICKNIIEKKLNIQVSVEIGSEFGYSAPIIDDGSIFIFLSQSGETADSMLVFNQVKNKYPIIAITNVKGSQMDRNADFSLLLCAGMEVAVASTKAYTAQIAVCSILVYHVCNDLSIFNTLEYIAKVQEKLISDNSKFAQIADELKNEKQIFYLGRLQDNYLSMEAALKIKEITYINVSAYASGELKHGTISLIEEGTKVVNIITDESICANSRSNNDEVRARGAKTYTFSINSTCKEGDDYCIDYDGDKLLSPLVSIIPHQYLAYYIALALGKDIDKPRNLAKSVTVE